MTSRKMILRNKIISALLGCLIGGGFGFALSAALSLKYQWTWGLDAPNPILHNLHVNGVLIGLTALGLALAVVVTNKVSNPPKAPK